MPQRLRWLFLLLLACFSAALPAQTWVTPPVQAPGVEYRVVPSAVVGGNVSYHLWLPPQYASEPERRFPVLVWLHGSGGGLAGIAPLAGVFDSAVRNGQLPPLIVLFPNGLPDGMWCDAASGLQPVESMLMQDLIPDVDARYRTLAVARARIVEGFSMGGYGAARVGLKYREHFAGFSLLGAGPMQLDFLAEGNNLVPLAERIRILNLVYGGDPAIFEAQSPWRIAESLAPAWSTPVPIRIAIGAQDPTLPANRAFRDHLLSLGIARRYTEVPGVGHSAIPLIEAMGDAYFSFHREALQFADRLQADGFEPR
ncbi:MAG: alpha/beta hydrolase-fold protein [Xanthomonadales bacterium]|jgi:enterochelin esterase-like enzyme|nr:alpha/beta hydrolase-fold protein [Xanthomonadales bacterium]